MRVALTIAGSDSGGGAGVQADLKVFFRFGVYGTSALTLVTAQNTLGVQRVHLLPPEVVYAQIESVAQDFPLHAAKTGALGDAAIVEAVAEAVRRFGVRPLVVDPVMVAKSGDPLLAKEAAAALKERLFPLADLVTPNRPEAEALLGRPIRTLKEAEEAAKALLALGPKAVLLKGGIWRGRGGGPFGHPGRGLALLRSPGPYPEHPRHRLHPLRRHRRPPRQGKALGGGGGRGQGLPHPGPEDGALPGPRPRAFGPLGLGGFRNGAQAGAVRAFWGTQ